MRKPTFLLAFNRGLMDPTAIARIDLKRTALSAEVMTNWMPRALGSMSIRAGLEYLDRTRADSKAVLIPFVFSEDDTALVEVTNNAMRVHAGGAVVSRPPVSTSIVNGDFLADLSGWTDSDEASSTSAWSAGSLSMYSTGSTYAMRDQAVSVAVADRLVEHALTVTVTAGLVNLSIGASAGGAEYAGPVTLRPGTHSIAFTPTGDFHLRLASGTAYPSLVSGVQVESNADMVLPTVWAESDLENLRWEQSGDVLFVCDGAHRQQRIERSGTRSWSVVDYLTEDGPYLPENITATTLTPGATTGATTLSASRAMFFPQHVGALFRLETSGQNASRTLTGDDQWTDPVRVTGVGASRTFTVTISGMAAGETATLQRSIGDVGDWVDFQTYTASGSTVVADGLDNQIVYYRVGATAAGWLADTYDVGIVYSAGSTTGVVRVSSYVSPTSVNVNVVETLGGIGATATWWEGRWSDHRGWPSAVAIHDGRLWWAGQDRFEGSVSDAYSTFDDAVEGDAGAISRNLGSGPVSKVAWIASSTQLLAGTTGSEMAARASSFDEPLTPTAFALRAFSTQGSAMVPAVKVDTSVVFVQRNKKRVYEATLSADAGYSFKATDLTSVVPKIGAPSIARMAVQRQPDTRIHCVRSDGRVAVLVYDKAEEVNGWTLLETDGIVEDVAVLPGEGEDEVYYVVRRTVGSTTIRCVEQFAKDSDATGLPLAKLSDSFVHADGPATSVSGLSHLEGATVVIWGNGKDLGTATVSAGAVTLPETATGVTVGLPYTASFKSSRIIVVDHAPFGSPRQIDHLGLVLANVHAQGLRYGQSMDRLDDLPLREDYDAIDTESVREVYDYPSVEVAGEWSVDARLCLEAASPRPCTVVACAVEASGHGK